MYNAGIEQGPRAIYWYVSAARAQNTVNSKIATSENNAGFSWGICEAYMTQKVRFNWDNYTKRIDCVKIPQKLSKPGT